MAVSLTTKEQGRTLAARKKNKTKNVLCTPFKETIEKIDKNVQAHIIENLVRVLAKVLPKDQKTSRLKEYLKIGVNETTKHLERDLLVLVIADSAANLPTMHLRQLCGIRRCPFIVLNGLECTCLEVLKVTRLSCIGFTKQCTALMKEFVDFAIQYAPSVDLPWLQFEQIMSKPLSVPCESDESETACDIFKKPEESAQTNEAKDFSYLYTFKTRTHVQHIKQEQESFGSAFLALGSDSDSDDIEQIVSLSGRIKLFPKHKAEDAVNERYSHKRQSTDVLGLNISKKRIIGKGKKKVKRFFTEDSPHSNSYLSANLGLMKANTNRSKTKR